MLRDLAALHGEQDREDPLGRVHRLLSQWPSDDALPTEGIDGVKSIYKKLSSGLNEVKMNAENDVKCVSEFPFIPSSRHGVQADMSHIQDHRRGAGADDH